MQTTLKLVPIPMSSEFTMFEKIDLELLKQTKVVRISSYNVTKTRISTSIQVGKARYSINFPIEGFKTFEQSSYSYATYEKEVSHYFVKSKKQGFDCYQEYIIKLVDFVLVDKLGLTLDSVLIELEIWN